MAFGLSFQPAADQTPAERQSTVSALGPGQKALKILALHLPKLSGTPGPTAAHQMTPHDAVFRALVQSISGAPVGGHPTTDPLVQTLGHLPDSQTPSSNVSDNLLGPNGEWQAGRGELGPMTDGNDPFWPMGQQPTLAPSHQMFASLVSQLGGLR